MGLFLKTLAVVVQTRIFSCILVIIHNASGQADALALVIDTIDHDGVNASYATDKTAKADNLREKSNISDTETFMNVLERPIGSKFVNM